jgi:hypothetical protein
VLPRLWIVLLAVLLLAAPAGSAFEEAVDARPSMGLCDDAVIAYVEVPLAERAPERTIRTVAPDEAPAPEPLRDRIFRPPRPALARG